jgi:hypothetical protein
MAYSDNDGISWTAIPAGTANGTTTTFTESIDAIAYGNGRFVAGGRDAKMAYSGGGGGNNSSITYAATANNTTNTTAVNFTFSGAVSGLLANDITVTSGTGTVTKGSLTGSTRP